MSLLRVALLLIGALALAGCDPAGPAGVRLIPIGTPGDAGEAAPTGDGAPLDAMRPDASPLAGPTPEAAAVPAPEADGSADLAAAATAAVSDAPASTAVTTDSAALAAYAQANTHAVGTSVHSRDFASPERAARACARYASADQAQSAFLAAGGPAQDPRGLDPDGDGYACAWDPASARGGSAG